jgi:hypothetical protein
MLDVTSLNVFALCAPCLRHAGKVMLAVVMAIAAVAYTAVLREALWPGIVHPSSWWSAALHTLVLVSYTALVRLLLPPLPPALRHARLSVSSLPPATPAHPPTRSHPRSWSWCCGASSRPLRRSRAPCRPAGSPFSTRRQARRGAGLPPQLALERAGLLCGWVRAPLAVCCGGGGAMASGIRRETPRQCQPTGGSRRGPVTQQTAPPTHPPTPAGATS